MDFLYFFAGPIAFITRPIYNLVHNYGLTLIIVTIIVKLLTIPFTIMSQKNVAKTQLIQPELQKLQYKYRNDKNMLSVEMQKLYRKYDVNPLGGCLPLLLQMFILFGFIRVVYDPLTHILQIPSGQIKELLALGGSGSQVGACGVKEVVDAIKSMGYTPINFDFLGIDLTKMLKGNESDILLWIFPALATITTFLSSYISKKQMEKSKKEETNKYRNEQGEQAQNMSNTMMKIMPVLTAFFTYTMPVGMSLYWFVSTAVQLIQQTVLTNVINKKIKLEMESKIKK